MHEFLRMVFSELGSSIWLAMILVALIGGGIWWHQRRRGGEIRWKRLILTLLLAGYLVVLGYATMFRVVGGFGGVPPAAVGDMEEKRHFRISAFERVT